MVTAYETASVPSVSAARNPADLSGGRKRELFAAAALFLAVVIGEAVFITATAHTITDANSLSTFYISPP
jgi:hypothetical protein